MKEMPAAESGLKAGDLLLEIDGKDLKEFGCEHAASWTGRYQF